MTLRQYAPLPLVVGPLASSFCLPRIRCTFTVHVHGRMRIPDNELYSAAFPESRSTPYVDLESRRRQISLPSLVSSGRPKKDESSTFVYKIASHSANLQVTVQLLKESIHAMYKSVTSSASDYLVVASSVPDLPEAKFCASSCVR